MFKGIHKNTFRGICLALLLCLAASAVSRAEEETAKFYRVEQRNGVWWFVAPNGEPFFSNGVNVVSVGQSRENYRPDRPEYAAFRYYPNTEAWASETIRRLRAWNFNTIGGWSDREVEKRGAMPYTKVLHLSGNKLVPWGDVFGAEVARRIDETARREIGDLKNDPHLLGYFTDNELGWWDDTIFWHFLRQPETNATRKVLINLLRRHYKNNFARLRRDFDTGAARSFARLARESSLTLKPGGDGAEVIDEFTFLVAERYYKLVHDAIRRYDPNHLILGDRYPSWYSQAVVRASVPYVDVVSTNYMADWTDGNISHFYLDTLYRLTNKPIIVTEYYMSATENRSGNKNSSAGFPVVQTQAERAESFRRNLTAYADLPYVIGAHWFQYTDEPTFGRISDGEDYNMGLVDIHDVPYEELTAAAANLKPWEIHGRAAKYSVKTGGGAVAVPPAPAAAERGLRWWDKKASFVPAVANVGRDLPFGDLYAAWDEKNLYLAVYAADFLEARNYAGNTVPAAERMTWTIRAGAAQTPLQIHFGNGAEPTFAGATVEYKSWTNSTRSTLLVNLPVAHAGKKKWRAGDRISLDARLASHSRAEQMQWRQTLVLSETGRANSNESAE